MKRAQDDVNGRGRGGAQRRRIQWLIALSIFGGGLLGFACSGPERGFWAGLRGRTALLAEAEEGTPPPLGEAAGRVERASVRLFPLFFSEGEPSREVVEVLWPVYEAGRSSESSYFRIRPFFFHDRFRGEGRTAFFPFWWRSYEHRAIGERSFHLAWPFYGIERGPVDLAPAATHHVLYPLAYLRTSEDRWKVKLLPACTVSWGFLDRGWWLLPVIKAGAGRGGWEGGNRWLYVLDPLFAYERYSIAAGRRKETAGDVRTEIKVLGGLVGWESSGGRGAVRVFWFRLGGQEPATAPREPR